uniref:Uncharacterized protein n=1 Tax=Sphaerodactylus townsendi TaxID=933632 RepID=A0ACB8FAY5_9SAUR
MTGPTHGLLFERLNESNYVSWVETMKCFLIREGLWKAAQKAPDMDDDDEVEADEKARAAIVLAVENSQLVFLRLLEWKGQRDLRAYPQPPVNSISKDRGDKLAKLNAVRRDVTPVEQPTT